MIKIQKSKKYSSPVSPPFLRDCLKTWFYVISTEANEVSEVEKSLFGFD